MSAASNRTTGGAPGSASALSVANYDYVLPPGAIAQRPAVKRDGERLMVIDATGEKRRHTESESVGAFCDPETYSSSMIRRPGEATSVPFQHTRDDDADRNEVVWVERLSVRRGFFISRDGLRR